MSGYGTRIGAITDAEHKRATRARDRLIPYRSPAPADAKRRTKLERDPAAWLRWYLHERFPLPFGPVHHEIIKACMRGMDSGTSVTVAAPRGFGKTAILWGMALYGVMTGKARFPVVVGWKQTAGAELLDQWLEALASNERLNDGYPCVCDVFHDSTASKRLQGLLRSVEPEEKRAGCNVRKGRGTVLLPATDELETGRTMPQAALAGASMNGSIKGLNVGLLDGESLRPDIVMLDDPQDTATAESEQLINKVIKRIDYGLRSLSGPQRRLTVMAAVTCVEPHDVAEHLLTRPGTDAIRCGQVTHWPEGWTDKDSQSRAIWDTWNAERIAGLQDHDGGKRARAFYRRNKREMTLGMQVSWKYRYHVGDDKRPADPDAMFAAMWDFYDLGEWAFMAERQNAPMKRGVTVYNLTAPIVESRTDQWREVGTVPPWVGGVYWATDVNPSYGLTWVLAGFGADQTCAVFGYGVHPVNVIKENTPAQQGRQLYEAMVTLGRKVASFPAALHPNMAGFDLRGWSQQAGGRETALLFGRNSRAACGVRMVPMEGWSAKHYKPWHKTRFGQPREQCHFAKLNQDLWIAWHADYWRECMQKGWTGSPGAPGSCSLPKGNHKEFAEQICREQLAGKAEVGSVMMWDWHTAPGTHDYGDAMSMVYVLAAINGIGTSGKIAPKKYVETRKAKPVEEQQA